jgi:hypothetical protein
MKLYFVPSGQFFPSLPRYTEPRAADVLPTAVKIDAPGRFLTPEHVSVTLSTFSSATQ